MANDVVDGCAYGFGKSPVIERRRDGVVVENEIMAERIQRFRRYTGHNMRRDEVEHFGGETARVTHGLEFHRSMNLNADGFRLNDALCLVHNFFHSNTSASLSHSWRSTANIQVSMGSDGPRSMAFSDISH